MVSTTRQARADATGFDALAAAYDATPIGLGVIDRDLRFVVVNRRLAEINGIPAADHIGRTVAEVVPDLTEQAQAAIAQVLHGHALDGLTFVGTTPAEPGIIRTWREAWLPLRDPTGGIVGASVTVEEVTRETGQAAELATAIQRLELATRAADLGTHDDDVTTGQITWDGRMRALWGAGPDEPIDYATFAAGVHLDDLPAVERAVAAALTPGGGGRYRAEFRVRHRHDGAVRWVAATGEVTFADGRAVRLVGTVQDMTARRAAEARQSFLLDLSDRLAADRRASAVVARAIGEHVTVSRAGFAVSPDDGATFLVEHEYRRGDIPAVGSYRLADFGPWLAGDLRAGARCRWRTSPPIRGRGLTHGPISRSASAGS
jgi:PAS domain S-box-containing protein